MDFLARKHMDVRPTALLVALLALLPACGSEDEPIMEPDPVDRSLAGSWSRINSSFQELDGMVVLVDNAETQGVITSTPMNIYMFQGGDLKWRSIANTSVGNYTFEDLIREANTGAMSYVAGQMRVSANGDSLEVSFPTTGTFQEWLRAN